MRVQEKRRTKYAPAPVKKDKNGKKIVEEPPEVVIDHATGKELNPYIPNFIAKAPWYLNQSDPSLKHQRKEAQGSESMSKWYDRGAAVGPAATKFRKGACQNCGSMTHKVKDCLDRPRKVGAKYTGKDIQADEVISSIDLGFEAKRDRWNGYDPEDHVQVVKDWEVVEEKRAQLREAKMKEKLEAGGEPESKDAAEASSSDSEDDEADGGDKYAEEADVVGQHVDAKSRVTVRNLRIREDTAKYLKDLNASDYNPKNRIIKSTPEEKAEFRRANEAVARVIQLQTFAWDAEKRGQDVHIQANPTMGEIMYKQFHEKRKDFVEEQKTSVLAKYGGEEHLQAPPKELLLAQTEHYVEYTQDGKLLHGQDKPTIKSRYLEDIFPLNHITVWGSWWEEGHWGYKCCHSLIRSSYCTGQAGIESAESGPLMPQAQPEAEDVHHEDEERQMSLLDQYVAKAAAGQSAKRTMEPKDPKKRLGEGAIELDPKKLKAALDMQKGKESNDQQSQYNSLGGSQSVTEETLEAYRMEKVRPNDPMADYVDHPDQEF